MSRTKGSGLRILSLTKKNLEARVVELRKSSQLSQEVLTQAEAVMDDVRRIGDKALIQCTKRFDGVKLDRSEIRVERSEFEEAYGSTTQEQLRALAVAKERIESWETRVLSAPKGLALDEDGIKITRMVKPIASAGCYVPGGLAAYPSSLLMSVVPARVAGVRRVVVSTPPSKTKKLNPLVLLAADMCGVEEVYRVGGAQAIAALAYGTETIRPVNKIVGPGGPYVLAAKILASKTVPIDAPAGPTELIVLADEFAEPKFIARDLICQAEHAETSVCGLVTNSEIMAAEVSRLITSALSEVKRADIASRALASNGFILEADDLDLGLEFVNRFAPEHLQLMIKDAGAFAARVETSGLVLIGSYSPSSASDYCVGTNHILPTGGYGSRYSALSCLDFVKRIDIVECSKQGLSRLKPTIKTLAEAEGLQNHALSAEERFGRGGWK